MCGKPRKATTHKRMLIRYSDSYLPDNNSPASAKRQLQVGELLSPAMLKRFLLDLDGGRPRSSPLTDEGRQFVAAERFFLQQRLGEQIELPAMLRQNARRVLRGFKEDLLNLLIDHVSRRFAVL